MLNPTLSDSSYCLRKVYHIEAVKRWIWWTHQEMYSLSLRALLPEATADLLRSRACFLPDAARKMVARLETTLSGNRAYGQSCLFEHFDPLCYSLLPKIGDGRQRHILSKEAYQMKRTHLLGPQTLVMLHPA